MFGGGRGSRVFFLMYLLKNGTTHMTTTHMTTERNLRSQATSTLEASTSAGRGEGGDRSWWTEAPVFLLLVTGGVALRWACQDLPNFAPVAAMALFAGYFFRSALLALLVPLSVMAVSDWLFAGGYHWAVMAPVYGMLALPVLLRGWLRRAFDLRQARPIMPLLGLFSCGLMSSVLFFLVTNFGVWCGFGMYDRSVVGLLQCYAQAIPFFRYTLAGDMFFTVALFGSYALAMALGRERELASAVN